MIDNVLTFREMVLDRIDISREVEDMELLSIIRDIVGRESKKIYMSVNEKIKLSNEIYNSIRGFDVLDEILSQEDITEIMVNGYKDIFIERAGVITRYNAQFSSKEKLMDIIQQMVSGVNRRVNEASPIVDARLKDGSRVNIVLDPIAINGPILTIRRFPKKQLTMDDLIVSESVTKEAAEFLNKLVNARYNIFISGGTSSGKTTFLNILSNYIPKEDRIITIEDSAELRIENIENLVKLEARQANIEGSNQITIRDLIRSALRMRPTRIIVGEVRGKEALDMLQAMNTGHDGSLSTGHANSSQDMMNRLETMVLMGVDMPIAAIRSQIASALDIIVHLGRTRDRKRRVLSIDEVSGIENNNIKLEKLFKYDGKELVRCGELNIRDKLIMSGLEG